MKKSVSIILPTYNEAANIELLIEQIQKYINSYSDEIIVIDDNSPDKTYKIVENIIPKYSNVRLIHRTEISGLTSAIQTGINNSKKDLVLWMDADCSMHPNYIPYFLKNMDVYDICVGSRYIKNATDDRKEKLHVVLSKIINNICFFLLSKKITDWTTGFICSKRIIFNQINLKGDYGEYCIDFLYKSLQLNLKIKEIPYHCQSRMYGESKTATSFMGFWTRGKKYIKTIFTLKFNVFENK